jgi:MoaA/NifB/PqqE/SkfB family radical SAM enzyme
MSNMAANYVTNLARLLGGGRMLRPLVVAYCLVARCNLNCAYCEDFGARRNVDQPPALPLDDAQRLLSVVRQATDHLLLTGGEPLLYDDLVPLLAHARRALRFRHLTLLTNAARLHAHWDVLSHIDRLMVSVDTLDPEAWDRTLRAEPGTARRILDNVAEAAARQTRDRFRLVVNCVVTPATLSQAEAVLDVCNAHGALFSLSPQSVENWPHYDLLVSDAYREFVGRVMARKRAGAPVLASVPYLRMVRTFTPYACYPMLAPRVLPDGGLAYPCRPIERADDAHGGRDVNLLTLGDWDAAVQRAADVYGQPPSTCGSCYQQCYIEPSLMQTRPWALAWEWLRYAPARRGRIATYAPG